MYEATTKKISRDPIERLGSEDLQNLRVTSAPTKMPRHSEKINNKKVDDTDDGSQQGIIVTKGKEKYLCAFEEEFG